MCACTQTVCVLEIVWVCVENSVEYAGIVAENVGVWGKSCRL